MVNFNSEWNRLSGLMKLFFLEAEKDYKDNLRAYAKSKFQEKHIYAAASKITKSEADKIDEIIHAIKSTLPHLEAEGKMQAILWIRWGNETFKDYLSREFIQKYGEWHANKSQSHLLYMRVQADGVNWKGRKWMHEKFGEISGFTLDEITLFFGGKRSDLYKMQWELVMQNRKPSGDKSLDKIVGPTVLENLEKCVSQLAKSGQTKFLSKHKNKDNRYKCELSREDLIKKLKKKFPVINDHKDSVLFRSISKFVACPKGRPRKSKDM